MPKTFLFQAIQFSQTVLKWYYLTHSWEDKGVHTFPKGICLKVNVIARLGFELAYYDPAIQRFDHYTMRTPPYMCIGLSHMYVCIYMCWWEHVCMCIGISYVCIRMSMNT